MSTREESIERIRRFNRAYVPAMRLLDRSYLDTGMSTLETAVLIEIGEGNGVSARDISVRLNMDKGHLSRVIGRFEREGLVERSASSEDGRLLVLSLTRAGRRRVDELVEIGAEIVETAFDKSTDAELARVAKAMGTILSILER